MPEKANLYTDGAYNKKFGGVGVYERELAISLSVTTSKETTSNINEYFAVLLGISYIKIVYPDISCINVYSDSQLVIKQLNGKFAINASHLLHINQKIKEESKDKKTVFNWISRDLNKKSDMLAKAALKPIKILDGIASIRYSSAGNSINSILEKNLQSLIETIKILKKNKNL